MEGVEEEDDDEDEDEDACGKSGEMKDRKLFNGAAVDDDEEAGFADLEPLCPSVDGGAMVATRPIKLK